MNGTRTCGDPSGVKDRTPACDQVALGIDAPRLSFTEFSNRDHNLEIHSVSQGDLPKRHYDLRSDRRNGYQFIEHVRRREIETPLKPPLVLPFVAYSTVGGPLSALIPNINRIVRPPSGYGFVLQRVGCIKSPESVSLANQIRQTDHASEGGIKPFPAGIAKVILSTKIDRGRRRQVLFPTSSKIREIASSYSIVSGDDESI